MLGQHKMMIGSISSNPCANVNDTFTGADSSSFDSSLWKSFAAGTPYTVDIQSNKLQLQATDPGGGTNVPFGVESTHLLQGDFDIEVEVAFISSSSLIAVGMRLTFDNFDFWFQVSSSGATTEVRCDLTNPSAVVLSNNFGKLRYTRVGTTLTAYYKDGNDATWTQYDTGTCSADDLPYFLTARPGTNSATASSITTFDNFILNSGCAVPSSLQLYNVYIDSLLPSGRWKFNEPDVSAFIESTADYTGAYVNSPTVQQDGILGGKSTLFNGTNQYANTTDPLTVVPSPEYEYPFSLTGVELKLSATIWIYPLSYQSGGLITKGGILREWYIRFLATGQIMASISDRAGFASIYVISTGVVPLNQWSSITVTFDGWDYLTGTLKIYVNGVDVTGTPVTSNRIHQPAGEPIYFGYRYAGSPEYFHGKLDEAATFKSILSLANAQQIHALGSA